jgi:sulfur-oxidizing protein SoxA
MLMPMVTVAHAEEPERKLSVVKSGRDFQGANVQQMQADDFANPGMLWVARGEALWSTRAGVAQKSCSDCHGDAAMSMKGVAPRYPAFDTSLNTLLNLEGRINECRRRHQGAEPLAYESDELLGLTTYVANASRGLPLKANIDGPARAWFDKGRALYYQRQGQMNLACNHCHEQNWGRKLLGETVSQGQPNGYPAYRLEWQKSGSLHRRLRACYYGVRAELPAYGSDDLRALELFLAWRAQGLVTETPAVRR